MRCAPEYASWKYDSQQRLHINAFLFEPGEIFDGSQPEASFATFGKSFCKSLTPETILDPEHTGQLVAFLSVR